MLAAVAIAVAVLLPMLPPAGQKILMVIAAVPVLFCLYYMIVTPGWQPGQQLRLGSSLRWIAFVLVVMAIIGGVGWFLFS